MLLSLVALPVASALAMPGVARAFRGRAGAPAAVMTLASLAAFVLLLTQGPAIVDGEAVEWSTTWIEALDWEFALRLDGLSYLFALLITGIGTLIGWYGGSYMGADARNPRFFATLLLFQAGMLVAVLADDFVILFVGWEVTSVTSFMLIGFQHERAEARQAAQHALLVTSASGLALLGGLIVLGVNGGTWRLSALTAEGVAAIDPTLAEVALVLILLGGLAKSAQFPFHGWLPGAMAAPTPVSAYLHSATMVKLGIYLVSRLQPSMGDLASWSLLLPVLGNTMVLGAVLAVRERDLKRVLAYSTVSALGSMMMLAGFGTTAAMEALAIWIIAHACYKATLFMTAGTIDHETGTRDRLALGGLRGPMPVLGATAAVAAVSMAGLPPASGFLAKETQIAAAFAEQSELIAMTVAGAIALTGALTLVAAFAAGVAPFLGPLRETPKQPHGVPVAMWAPVALLAVLGIVLGLFASVLLPPFLDQVVAASTGAPYEAHLHLWGGFNRVLAVSALAIGGGIVLARFHRALPGLPWVRATSTGVTQGVLDGLSWLAGAVERVAQPGSLPVYIATAITLTVVPLLVLTVIAVPLNGIGLNGDPLVIAMAVVVGISALAAARSTTRIRAIAALGVTGYGITLIYLRFGAPDLAITQTLVDTLTVILFIFAFRFLPLRPMHESGFLRYSALTLAAVAGLAMTGLTLLLGEPTHDTHLREFFETASYAQAHGRNVVNTILVDFRAMDTLGEITVLSVAALGILGLLRLTGRVHSDHEHGEGSRVLRAAARAVVPLLVVFAFFLFLRGHNEPGGGFVAGLVAAAGVAFYTMAYDARQARRLLRVPPGTLIASGLLVAIAAAAFGTWFSPPLTGHWFTFHFAGAQLTVGTPLVFDLGVFIVVLGVASALATALLEEQR